MVAQSKTPLEESPFKTSEPFSPAVQNNVHGLTLASLTQLFRMKGLIRHDEGELNDALFEPIVALYEILGPLCLSSEQLHPILVFIADAIVSNLRSRVPPRPIPTMLDAVHWQLILHQLFDISKKDIAYASRHMATIEMIGKASGDPSKVDIDYELETMLYAVSKPPVFFGRIFPHRILRPSPSLATESKQRKKFRSSGSSTLLRRCLTSGIPELPGMSKRV